MHLFSRWQRWVVVLFGLPVAVLLSTLALSQTQLIRLVPSDLPLQPALWSALQLSLASSLIWFIWREAPQIPAWRTVGQSLLEGVGLFGVALGISWYLQLIDISWDITTERIVTMGMMALPLAWWCMAEERLMRVELCRLLSHQKPLLRDVSMIGIGWIVQFTILSAHTLEILVVILLTEGLSVLTWSGSAHYDKTWTRRWAWRWLLVAGAGLHGTGFVISTPAPIIVTADDTFVLVLLVAAPLVAWVSLSGLQQYMHPHE